MKQSQAKLQQQKQGVIATENMLQQCKLMVDFLNLALGDDVSLSLQMADSATIMSRQAGDHLLPIAAGDGSLLAVLQVQRHDEPLTALAPAAELIPFPTATTVVSIPDAGAVSEAALRAVQDLLDQYGVPAERLNKQERMEIVSLLNKQGVFLLKGAVSNVARQLHCSEPTLYRYLAIANKSN